jgi:hypothetical protein
MISVMRKDPDPRFKNSKYLEFLDRISSGEWQIKGEKIIKNQFNKQVLNNNL